MTEAPRIRVAIVDDQALIRVGLAMVLNSQPDIDVVLEASDGAVAVAQLAPAAVDVVLMDVRMPGLDGLTATRALVDAWAEREDPPRIVILTTFDLDEYALDAIRAGASGFLLKDTPPEDLLTAIRTIYRGDAVIAPSTTRRLLAHLTTPASVEAALSPLLDTLTEREREVLELVAAGLSNGEIAQRLVVAEATVKTHIGRLLAKTQSRDRVQLVVLAYESGLVTPTS
jgi:DNA-binding NarL/FixJ family response regulator